MQTVADIKRFCREHHVVPSKGWGQHFLVDPWVDGQFLAALALAPGQRVLEIGAGLGALTEALLEAGADVTAVERDHRLAQLLKARWGRHERLHLVVGDVLAFDWATLTEPVVVAGNLPYSVTSPVLERLVQHVAQVRRAVLTVQREVAQRIAAGPGGKTYGALTCFVQSHFVPELVVTIPPKAFYPQPEVTSAIIRLTPCQPARVSPGDLEAFVTVVQALFQRRRKTLLNGLLNPALALTRDEAAAMIRDVTLDPQARPETISVMQMADLARHYRTRMAKGP